MNVFSRAFDGDDEALRLLTAIERVGTAQSLQPGDEDALNASEQGWPQHARDAGLDYRGGRWVLADRAMYEAFVARKNAARTAWHAKLESSVYGQLDDKISELRGGRGGGECAYGSAGSNASSEGVLLESDESLPRFRASPAIDALRSSLKI